MLLLRNTGYTEAEAHLDGVHVFCHDLSAEGNEDYGRLKDPEKRRAMGEHGFHVISNEFQDIEYKIELIRQEVPFTVNGYT